MSRDKEEQVLEEVAQQSMAEKAKARLAEWAKADAASAGPCSGMVGVHFPWRERHLSQGGEGKARPDYPALPSGHQVAARDFVQTHDAEQSCSYSCSIINGA